MPAMHITASFIQINLTSTTNLEIRKEKPKSFSLCFYCALSCIILLSCEISSKDLCAKQTLTCTVHVLK